MTREEEIFNVAEFYAHTESPCEIISSNSFIAGAIWADNNPDLSSLWHDASEEPKEDMDILLISKNGKVNKVSKIDQTLYDWLKDNDGIDKWAYISDLLPKGGEK